MPLRMQVLKKCRKALELPAIVLDQVLMREEQNIRVPQGLMHISMTHQLLIGESFIGLFFLMLRHECRGDEIHRLSDSLKKEKFEVPDFLLHEAYSLKGRHDEVS